MSLMTRVDGARSRLQTANEQLLGARNEIVWSGIGDRINKLTVDVGKGAGEAVADTFSSLWNTVTNPVQTAKDTWAGIQEAVDDPIGAAKEAWNDFTEPYVEDWENGHPGQAIGRGLAEIGQMAVPGLNVVKGTQKALDILGGLGKDDDPPEIPNDSDSSEPEDTPSDNDGSAEKPKSEEGSLDDPNSLAGKSPEDIREMIPENYDHKPSNRGGGERYSDPDRPGDQIRIMPGNPNDPDPVKQGPYLRISKSGKKSPPIPLEGNPTL